METIVAAITVLSVIGIPIGISVVNFRRIKSRWKTIQGVKVDYSGLSGDDLNQIQWRMPIALDVIGQALNRYPALGGLKYRVHIIQRNTPVFPGAAATGYKHRDWPWSKPVWVVHATFANERRNEWWFEFIPHELFAHIAYDHIGKGTNRDHSATEFLDVENETKARLRELISK